MGKLDGKIAVITGGSSGIGLATAQRFVTEGAYAFITGRRQSELDKAVKQIGKNVTGVQGDVANLADLDRLYATVKQQKGHIDVLFANAGSGEFAALGTITEEHFDKASNANIKGLLSRYKRRFRYLRMVVRLFSTPRSQDRKDGKHSPSIVQRKPPCARFRGHGPWI